MAVLLHHLLLAGAVLALGDTGLRAAARLGATGLERLVAAMVLAGACAVVEGLALGLLGVGSSPAALGLGALAAAVAARVWLPRPTPAPRLELAQAAAGAGLPARLGMGAAIGLLVVLTVSFLSKPVLGIDGVTYHLPEVVSWVHGGAPGAEINPSEDLPSTSYPLTNEVLLSWAMSLSRSFVPVAVWTPALLALLAAAGWLGLRRMGVPIPAVILAGLAVALSPDLVRNLNGPKNDLAALAWLAAAAALCVAARRRSALLAVAVVAGGLSMGTKPTTAPLVALVLGGALAGAWRRRPGALPAGALVLGATGAVAVGGVWYLRDLIEHGSPLWPVVAAPWGDPLPPLFARVNVSFLERPLASLTRRGHEAAYVSILAGGLVLLAGGALAGLLVRRRTVVVASTATVLAGLAWARAPLTGIPDDPILDASLSNTRYLLPTLAAGATALALAARSGGWAGRLAIGLLAAAAGWSAVKSEQLGVPYRPALAALAVATLLGAATGAVASTIIRHPTLLRAGGAAALAVGALGLGAAAPGYVERHAKINGGFAAPVLAWLAARADFRDGHEPIEASPETIGPLAGDRLQHPVQLIPGSAPCSDVRARARRGWVVVRDIPGPVRRLLVPYSTPECLASERPIFDGGGFRVYRLPAPTMRR